MASFVRRQQKSWPWLVAAVVIVVGWAAGYVGSQPRPGYGSYFTADAAVVAVGIGAPGAAVAGLLLRLRRKWLRRLGGACLVGVSLALAIVASSVFFDICVDPGEACVTSWASRLVTVMAAVGSLVPGYLISVRSSGFGAARVREA